MGTTEEYMEFNRLNNLNGRWKYTKHSLEDIDWEEEMPVTSYYGPRLSEEERERYIKTFIAFGDDELANEIMGIVDNFGNYIETLNFLERAAQKGRLLEFKDELKAFYEKSIGIYDLTVMNPLVYSSIKKFLSECYGKLGISVEATDL